MTSEAQVSFRRTLVLCLGAALSATPLVALSAQTASAVSGTVRDALTSEPLDAVQIKAEGRVATTDREGRFTITPKSSAEPIVFRRIGYSTRVLRPGDLGSPVLLSREPVLMTSIVVGTPTTNELAVGTALAVTSVTRDQLGSRAGTSTAERLEGIEGVSVQRWSSWGATTMLRGLGDQRLAVLINGARVNPACPFGMDLGLATIDPATIERIEVLAGPGSTLYGSGNIGGVINVVTRRAPDGRSHAGEFRVGGSSAVPGGSLGASAWGQTPRLDYAFSFDGAGYGDYRSPEGRVPSSSFRDATAEATLGFRITPAQRLGLELQGYGAQDVGYAAMGANIPRETRATLAANYGWQLSHTWLDAFSARAYVQRLDHRMTMDMSMDDMMAGMPMTMDDRSHATTSGARVQVRVLPWTATHIDAGTEVTLWNAEARRLTEVSDDMGGSSSLALRLWPGVNLVDAGAFAQGESRVNKLLTVSAGGRMDRIGKSADKTTTTHEWVGTGNAGLRVDLTNGFQARASFGAGYRVPSPSELFGLELKPDGNIYRGNPNLRTETSRNIEGTLAWSGPGISASATAFRNDVSGMISPVLTADAVAGFAVLDYHNVESARLTGGTGSIRLQANEKFLVTGTAGYTGGENRDDGSALPLIPPFEWSFSARHSPGTALSWVEAEVRGAAEQSRVAIATAESTTPGYAILNVRSRFALRNVGIVTGVENVLDKSFRSHVDPVGLLRPGRNVFVRVTQGF